MGRLIRFLRYYCFPTKDIKDRRFQNAVYAITTFRPNNLTLYKLALQHSSIISQTGAQNQLYSNERLEYLGDAVLSLVIAEFLFKKYPLQEEGFLTEIRSRIVNRASLSEIAKKIGIDELLSYDTRCINQHNLKFIYGNALEAFIGAVYLDHGYQPCASFIIDRLLHIHVDLETLVITDNNHKSKIISWAQKNRKSIQFELIHEKCNKGYREFLVRLILDGKEIGEGYGKTKKQAEQMAAYEALKKISKEA